jgi:hypothetical protein
MHLFGGSDDGINRTGLNTQRAANTCFWINPGYWTGPFNPTLWINILSLIIELEIQYFAQANNAFLTSGWAAIWFLTIGHRFCVSPAIRIAAFGALGLRKGILQ